MQQIQRVYHSPKLWYLRVSIIEAQHIMPAHRGLEVVRFPEFSTKVQVGNQIWRTQTAAPSDTRSFSNPYWNEELLFVVTEPFEDYLAVVSVVDRVKPKREEVVYTMHPPWAEIVKRTNEEPVTSWFDLDNHFGSAGDNHKSQIYMKMSLDEGYDVLDEGTIHSSSDFRTTDKRLWKPHVGVLEMRILGATGLMPMKIKDGRGVTDAYCVAKYGQEWVRTHTVVDSFSPKWNEQYMWEVYDPCSILTIGVFDDCQINESTTKNTIARIPMGKVRIRLSTIETDRDYVHSFPLPMLHLNGVKKMGELQLALRFSCTNWANMLRKYMMTLLPSINYTHSLSGVQLDGLRDTAFEVVASKLSTEVSPLGRDVVGYMDMRRDLHMWSMRRSKANLFRLMGVLSSLVGILKWLEAIRNWKNPVSSAFFLIIFLTLVMLPAFIIPTIILLCVAFVGLWNYRYRPRHPPHLDTRLSHADAAHPDELEEEFDTNPANAPDGILRWRYDRLRSIAGRIQTVVADVATMGERLQGLLSWRDPRATFLFVVLCLVAAVGFCVVPIRVVVALLGMYSLRPPRLRSGLPPLVVCFFKRLPFRDPDSTYLDFGGEPRDADYSHELTKDFLIVRILEDLQQHM